MSTAAAPAPGVNRRTAIVASAVIVGLVGSGALVWRSTSAAFTAETSSPNSSWATGTLGLTNSKPAGALFNESGLVPGTAGSKCITVTYTGNVATSVRLYAAALAQTNSVANYLDLVVTQGTAGAEDCTGFLADGTGQIFSGTLTAFGAKTAFADGVGTWTPSTNGTTKVYRIDYSLNASAPDSTQGSSSSVTFTWEAQSGS